MSLLVKQSLDRAEQALSVSEVDVPRFPEIST
jgi:hypothetical protein